MMKKILVVGKNSYVGKKFITWMKSKYGVNIVIESVGVKNGEWEKYDFHDFDVLLHVAGLAHIKETSHNKMKYHEINCILTKRVAEKAKRAGIKQFIFLSSMSVYGVKNGVINKKTPLNPINYYGHSKLEAEKILKKLENEDFKVVILRPPMIYGMDCKGNYQKLRKFAIKSPYYPDIENKRSMIFIDNLSKFIELIITNGQKGTFCPQDKEYIQTKKMIQLVSRIHDTNIKSTYFFNPIIKYFLKVNIINKIFGNLIYDRDDFLYEKSISENFIDFKTAMRLTEEKK